MKTNLKKVVLPILLLVTAALIIGPSCSGPGLPPPLADPCSTIGTPLQNSLTAIKASGQAENITYDTEIHSYAFKMSVAGKICSIGYQSQPAIANMVSYKMEILNNSGVIYTENMAFNSSQVSYVAIPPVALLANTVYVIRRTTLPSVNVVNRIGSVVANAGTNYFPYTNGIMTITSSQFYDINSSTPSALANKGIPRIDFAFIPD